MGPSFKISEADNVLVRHIAHRAVGLFPEAGTVLEVTMDLTATHANGCPMDFDKLAAADDFNLLHDVVGIGRHLDRETGKLGGCFVPRCALPTPRELQSYPSLRKRTSRGRAEG